MKTRPIKILVLAGAITLAIFVSLGETSFQIALARTPSKASAITETTYKTNTITARPIPNHNQNQPLHSTATLTATDVATTQIFLPLVIGRPAVPEFVALVVNATNVYRTQQGCQPLILNDQLTAAAQGHSQDMALNDFFSHTGSDGSSSWERILRTGYRYSLAAENIAAGYPTSEAVVQGWMDSDGHRQNILDCDLREVGVGYYYLENDRGAVNYHHYWTQVFATP